MGYYLLDHPNPHGDHFYRTRTSPLVAIVVHITAGLEDLDAWADVSAENTARYAATTERKVSWHSGSDADSVVQLLPPSYTAWHVAGYNSGTYGHEISKRTTDWNSAPEPWLGRTLAQAAAHLGPLAELLRIPRRLATRAELDLALRTGRPCGFVSHWQLDPARRSDPGLYRGADTFPWTRFFALMGGATPNPSPEDDMSKPYLTASQYTGVTYHDGAGATWLSSADSVAELTRQGIVVYRLDASESDARRVVAERYAGTDEAILASLGRLELIGHREHDDLVKVEAAIRETLAALDASPTP